MSGVRGRRQHSEATTAPLPGGEIAAAAALGGGLASTPMAAGGEPWGQRGG